MQHKHGTACEVLYATEPFKAYPEISAGFVKVGELPTDTSAPSTREFEESFFKFNDPYGEGLKPAGIRSMSVGDVVRFGDRAVVCCGDGWMELPTDVVARLGV